MALEARNTKRVSLERKLSGVSFVEALIPLGRTEGLGHLPKAPAPNTIALGVRISA